MKEMNEMFNECYIKFWDSLCNDTFFEDFNA